MYSEVEGLERAICQIEDKITTLLPFVNCVVVSWREQRIQALLECGDPDLKSDEIKKLEDSLQGTLHILQQYNARAMEMADTSHFKRACAAFKRCFDEHDDSPSGMVLQVINQQDENHGLVFKRELLPPSSQTGNPRVEYYLRWHVTWGPVLTFTLHDLPPRENSHDLELAYRYLVRPQDELRLKNGGVGGIKGVIRWTVCIFLCVIPYTDYSYHLSFSLEKGDITTRIPYHPSDLPGPLMSNLRTNFHHHASWWIHVVSMI